MKLSSYGVNKLVKHIFLLKADAIDVIEIYIKIHEHYVTTVYIYFLCSIISRVSVGFCYERESAFKVEGKCLCCATADAFNTCFGLLLTQQMMFIRFVILLFN